MEARPDAGSAGRVRFASLDADPIVREAVLRLARHLDLGRPDVAVVDFRLAQAGDADLVESVCADPDFTGVVLLSKRAIERGAAEARRGLEGGGRFGASSATGRAYEEVLALEQLLESLESRPFRLTERERAVLGLMAEGASNSEIARELGISLSTVKSHVAQIMRKLGTRKRANAIVSYLTGRLDEI